MKTYLLTLPLLAFTAASLSAQTQPNTPVHHTVVHHTAEHHTATRRTEAHRRYEGGCVTVPELSPKIPAVPAGSPCAKALYTLTRTPDLRLDYVSPLVSPAQREALSTTPSTFSLDYIDTEIGTGPLAEPHMWYTVHYTGYLPDGKKFDSSYDRGEPISFPYGQHRVIQGWDTGFEGMHVGGKRRLFVPYQLAYGEAGRPPVIPAKSELIFDVELVAQSPTEPKPMPRRMPRPESRPESHPAPRPLTPPQPHPLTHPTPSSSTPESTPTRPTTPSTNPEAKPNASTATTPK